MIAGHELVVQIENLKVNTKNRPINDVVITNCGQLVRKRKISLSDQNISEKEDSL